MPKIANELNKKNINTNSFVIIERGTKHPHYRKIIESLKDLKSVINNHIVLYHQKSNKVNHKNFKDFIDSKKELTKKLQYCCLRYSISVGCSYQSILSSYTRTKISYTCIAAIN